jgi:hypothetical protein
MSNPINYTPLTQFAQLVRSAELSQAKEIKIPLQQARLINLALVEMMEKMLQDYETIFNSVKNSSQTEVVTVSMDGGGFGSK